MALINQGRQDWQRTVGADSALLVANAVFVLNTGAVTFGPFNVAGFWSLQGEVQVTGGGWVRCDIGYFADQARTQLQAAKVFAVDSGGSGFAQIFTPAYGPWVTIGLTPTTGATAWTSKTVIAATVRQSSGLISPTNPHLLHDDNLLVGAGATSIRNWAETAQGEVQIAYNTSGPGLQFFHEVEISSGTWSTLNFATSVGADSTQKVFNVPPFPIRTRIVSTAGAGITYNYSAVLTS